MRNRREFIKQASVAGAGLFVAPSIPLFAGSPNEKVVIGTMGTNSWGFFVAKMFAQLPNVEIGYVCDVDSNVVAKTIAEIEKMTGKKPKGFTEVRKMLEEKDMDAMMVATPTGNDIVTTQAYGPAFDLRFEFKLATGANSGVKYFVDEQYKPGGKSGIGLAYQLLDDDRHPDAKQGVVGNRTMGSLYDLIPSLKFEWAAAKIGQWNQGRIVSHADGRVAHYLNNIRIVAYQRGDPAYRALVARSKYANWNGFGMATAGSILLQNHGHAVSFRSIRIRTNHE